MIRLLSLWFALVLAATAFAGERLNFNPDWKFIKADPSNAAAVDYDDSGWNSVSLPHTFNDVDSFDDWSIAGHVGEMNLWAGRTWYRKSFTLPESFKGRKVYIEFEAVRQIAEVYLNGKLLGMSKTGFLPFGFDLTPHLRFGGAKNVLAVMADNRFTLETEMPRIIASELPWNSPHWHPAHGGIYRNVFLHVMDPLHISLPLYSFLQTAGPYVYATGISSGSAEVHVEVPLENERKSGQKVELRAVVLDRGGKSVLELKQGGDVASGGKTEIKLAGALANPQLWEPAYPYLYRVVCSLMAGGKVVDSREIPLGIRTARWNTGTGFYINGRHLKLHGWGQKPTDEWPGLGNAHPDWMHFYTLQLMKDAGGNFVRWGHCAGSPASIAAGDRLGIIADQPGVDGEGDTTLAWDLRASAFRDTIIYFRNNPSILIWEGGNQKVIREHAKQLRGYMDQYDPHGGRVYAHRRADEVSAEFMDIGIGTEGGREIARLPVVEGEYDREESPRRVWDDFSPPNFGYPEAKGQTYQLTSEQYAVNQVTQYVDKLGAANHSGGANWIFSDSTSGGRVATEVARASGEVDGVRLPKEAYYVCKTMFSDEPQVHIIGHWTYPAKTKKTVYVASNAEAVELFVNGKSLGRGSVSRKYLFTFPDVVWEAGEIRVAAYNGGKQVATQSKRTAGPPVALRMTPMAGPGGLHADGSDILLIDVEAVDANGQRCPTFQQRVDFAAEGAGEWRGGYNSGKINSTNNPYLDLEAGVNRVAVRAMRTPGKITVRAASANLKPAVLTVESLAVKVQNGYSSDVPALPEAALPQGPAAAASAAQPAPALGQAQAVGRFITRFSYSGPTTSVRVEQGAGDGKRVYTDSDLRFSALPLILRGSDYVQASNNDRLYSAVDLMEIAVSAGSVVFVAHDDRLPRPAWLTEQFKPAAVALKLGGRPMTLFQRRFAEAGSLTLGSNAPDAASKDCYMYLVFVAAAAR
jgi:beta-galactosidase